MQTRTHSEETSKQQSETENHSKKSGGESALQFRDKREEGITQSNMQEAANNSSQAAHIAQYQKMAGDHASQQTIPLQKKENKTGLPDDLKSGIESLSGMSMDHVKTHYNSDRPAQLNAHAYAQGSDIFLGSGQEKHLPHEAWHVVQQAQGRVKPTVQMKAGVPVNDDTGLETEADVMGAKAKQVGIQENVQLQEMPKSDSEAQPVQRLAVQHGITPAQYAKRSRYTTYAWARLEDYGGTFTDLTPVKAGKDGHAEDQVIEEAEEYIGDYPGTFSKLELWVSSSPCSVEYGTRDDAEVDEGCLEELEDFSNTTGLDVHVHAQKPYQPQGMGPGMKQNSVDAAEGSFIPHDFDNRTGVARDLDPYVAPPGVAPGSVAQLAGKDGEVDEEELAEQAEKKKKGKVTVTYE